MDQLTTLKKFLRIDGSEDDVVLTSLINAGKSHMRQAGVIEPVVDDNAPEDEKKAQEEDLDQYNLAIMLYVKREYDPHTGLELSRIDQTIQGIILQLRDYKGGNESE